MENKPQKMEVSLLAIIGSCVGTALGVGAGYFLGSVIFDGLEKAIVGAIFITAFGGVLGVVILAILVGSARKKNTLVRGEASHFAFGCLGGIFFFAAALFIYNVGYGLGCNLAGKLFTMASATMRAVASVVAGTALGVGSLWAAYHLLGRLARYKIKKLDKTNNSGE